MKYKFLNSVLASVIFFTSHFANAGLLELVDVDINSDGTNSGFTLSTNNYNLIWMDFGIYNNISLTDMNTHLNNSLNGWRYATYDEAYFLLSTIFSDHLVEPDIYRLDVSNTDRSNLQFFNHFVSIAGVNNPTKWNPAPGSVFTQSYGYITDGGKSNW